MCLKGFADRMGFFKKKPPAPALTRDEALRCIPVKSEAVQPSRTPEGMIRLRYPLVLKPWLAELARRFSRGPAAPPSRQLELDELGSLTWDLIDGQRTVSGIVQHFARQTQAHPKEAEAAVAQFLRELGRRGLIAMASERYDGNNRKR
jgi:hypothetical protein